jgi:hypothetical protein
MPPPPVQRRGPHVLFLLFGPTCCCSLDVTACALAVFSMVAHVHACVCACVVACGCDRQIPWSEAASLEAGCGVVPRPRVLQPHGCCTSWPRCGWKHQVRNVHSVSATALLGKDNSVSSGLLHTWHLKMSSSARVVVRCLFCFFLYACPLCGSPNGRDDWAVVSAPGKAPAVPAKSAG